IPHGKGERRIRPRRNQSQISARFDGNLTVEAYTRHRRLPDLSKTRAGCDIRSTSTKLPGNHSEFLHRTMLRGSHRFTATGCVPKVRLSPLSQLRSAITGEIRLPRNNSPDT